MVPPKEFFKKITPFSFLSPEELETLVSELRTTSYPKGSYCYRKGEIRRSVHVLSSGLVALYDGETLTDYVSRGELFGVLTAIDGSPAVFDAKVLEDCVCFRIPNERFKEVFEANGRFSSFFRTFLARRFRSFSRLAREREMFEEDSLIRGVGESVSKRPVVCSRGSTVEEAVTLMERHNVGSVVVVGEDGRPEGIFTNKDLRRVLLSGSRTDAVTSFMSSPLVALDAGTPLLEGYHTLIRSHVDYLGVTREGRLEGVVTSKDLLGRLEPSTSILGLYRKILKATDFDELKGACSAMRMAVVDMAVKGFHFEDLSRMITAVNDTVIKKVLELAGGAARADGFVWVQMGSSGRKEQVITTDQDNAVVAREPVPESFARRVNDMLEEVGIPKCKAHYMASNPLWNVDVEAWKGYFSHWFDEPTPDHVRHLTIFLDMRPLYGEEELYRELLDHVYAAKSNQAIRFLAFDAASADPPVGILGIKHLDKGVDLKTYGIYPITNGVRVLALDHRVLQTGSTRERMEALRAMKVLGEGMCSDLRESYAFMQDLRLRHQGRAVVSGKIADNRVTVEELDKMDLLVLKESLKVVASFQRFLKNRYGVEMVIR